MRVVLCNCSPAESEGLARALVEEGLAACVNVLPGVRSFYRWQGELQEDGEHTLLIKTTEARAPALASRLRALHSYELPEILSLPVDESTSDPRYLRWVTEMTEARA
jgi:periplasmic divalent cation tolerance protein